MFYFVNLDLCRVSPGSGKVTVVGSPQTVCSLRSLAAAVRNSLPEDVPDWAREKARRHEQKPLEVLDPGYVAGLGLDREAW